MSYSFRLAGTKLKNFAVPDQTKRPARDDDGLCELAGVSESIRTVRNETAHPSGRIRVFVRTLPVASENCAQDR